MFEFGAGISPDNLTVERDGNDLLFLSSGSDQVRVTNYFGSAGFGEIPGIREFLFNDGTIWATDDIDAHLSDIVEGTVGADSLIGSTGNDILIGDAGNDTLAGGDGNDIYRYALGTGPQTPLSISTF